MTIIKMKMKKVRFKSINRSKNPKIKVAFRKLIIKKSRRKKKTSQRVFKSLS
jgi:hypothetical protein